MDFYSKVSYLVFRDIWLTKELETKYQPGFPRHLAMPNSHKSKGLSLVNKK